MRIRTGFVSNSSSSSYIININITPEKFFSLLYNEYSWRIGEVLKNIDGAIISNEKWLLQVPYMKDICDGWVENRRNTIANRLSELIVWRDILEKNIDCNSTVRAVLEYSNINTKIRSNTVELNHFTVMHNDFNDMPRALREIILYFLFDTKYIVWCQREDTQ